MILSLGTMEAHLGQVHGGKKCSGGKNQPNIKTGKKHKRSMRESKNLLALFAIVTELLKVLTSGSTFIRYPFSPGSSPYPFQEL